MSVTKLEPSRYFADLRAAHRGDRSPPEFRQRMRERFESGSSPLVRIREQASLKGYLLPSSSLSAFCSLSALGALLIWLVAHPRLEALEAETTSAEDALSAPSTADTLKPGQRSKSGRLCPLSEVPAGAFIEPGIWDLEPRPNGLAVRTLTAQTESCGPLVRRYLELVPGSLAPQSSAPILIVLHDQGQNDGWLRVQETRWYFDALARRESFVLVYANAAPSAATVAQLDNSGGWQTHADANPEIDDEAYIDGIVRDLTARGVVSGENDVLLVGFGEGGSMALAAAARRPDRYAGVAAFEPTRVDVVPVLGAPASRLSRVLLVTADASESGGASPELRAAAQEWAAAIGALARNTRAPAGSEISRSVMRHIDLVASGDGRSVVRLLMIGGDLFPPPGAADPLSLAAARQRPGFVDGAEQVWTFLSNKERSRG